MKALRLSPAFPVNTGAATVPVAVSVCWCPAKAEPVKVGALAASVPVACRWELPAPEVTGEPVNVCALVVFDAPLNVGTPAGHEIVGWVKLPAPMVGTPAGQEIVPAGVRVMLGPSVVPVATPPVLLAVEIAVAPDPFVLVSTP